MRRHKPAGCRSVSITELLQRFGDRWRIAYLPALNVWSAEQRSADGRHIRFLCQHSTAALADKLAIAETDRP
jgi:hypothetical protein